MFHKILTLSKCNLSNGMQNRIKKIWKCHDIITTFPLQPSQVVYTLANIQILLLFFSFLLLKPHKWHTETPFDCEYPLSHSTAWHTTYLNLIGTEESRRSPSTICNPLIILWTLQVWTIDNLADTESSSFVRRLVTGVWLSGRAKAYSKSVEQVSISLRWKS